jgi:hypothetical protein
MKRSTTPSKSSTNAFVLLMGSQTKKKPRQPVASRFVPCPAGCGRHVLEKDINVHLDSCISNESPSLNEQSVHNAEPPKEQSDKRATSNLISAGKEEKIESRAKASPPTSDEHANAFAHMMKRSAKVFSTSEDARLAQRCHLNVNGSLSLTCYSTNPGLSQPEDIKWSTTVQLKAKKSPTPSSKSNDNEPARVSSTVDLSLSSAIASSPRKVRLVRRHSRLSIPVLKSILQKAIRRRKPLPAVRVAMELADKSLGDLLRRLPIIILEDSSFHPSFALLTWLMAAHSKDFEPNQFLMTKILCAVYEMASCPWQDHLNDASKTEASEQVDGLSFESYHKPGLDNLLEDSDTAIWSMLVRSRYGGMGCDVRMLNLYAKEWNRRFQNDCDIPDPVKERVTASLSQTECLRWSSLPAIIHHTSMRQSTARVQPMVEQGLTALTFMDITTEGVDFHCSSILDVVIADHTLVKNCVTQLGDITGSIGLGPMPSASNEKRAWLERVLKRCMWNFSAGVNRRLPLVLDGQASPSDKKDDPLEQIWRNLILPKTKAFAEHYVRERLA